MGPFDSESILEVLWIYLLTCVQYSLDTHSLTQNCFSDTYIVLGADDAQIEGGIPVFRCSLLSLAPQHAASYRGPTREV